MTSKKTKINMLNMLYTIRDYICSRIKKEKGNMICFRPSKVVKSLKNFAADYTKAIFYLYEIQYQVIDTSKGETICVRKEDAEKFCKELGNPFPPKISQEPVPVENPFPTQELSREPVPTKDTPRTRSHLKQT